MFNFLFRVVGLFVLAFAFVLIVLDMTRSIAGNQIIMTPLVQTWEAISPNLLQNAQTSVERWTSPVVWDPIILSLLILPSWFVFTLFAFILLWLGRKRENQYGRFASD